MKDKKFTETFVQFHRKKLSNEIFYICKFLHLEKNGIAVTFNLIAVLQSKIYAVKRNFKIQFVIACRTEILTKVISLTGWKQVDEMFVSTISSDSAGGAAAEVRGCGLNKRWLMLSLA